MRETNSPRKVWPQLILIGPGYKHLYIYIPQVCRHASTNETHFHDYLNVMPLLAIKTLTKTALQTLYKDKPIVERETFNMAEQAVVSLKIEKSV